MLWSGEFNFTSAPTVDPDRTTKFAVLGDMGTVPLVSIPRSGRPFCAETHSFPPSFLQGFIVTDQIIKTMPDFEFDALMHVGDIAYAGIVR